MIKIDSIYDDFDELDYKFAECENLKQELINNKNYIEHLILEINKPYIPFSEWLDISANRIEVKRLEKRRESALVSLRGLADKKGPLRRHCDFMDDEAPALPDVLNKYFITISFPHREKIALNRQTKLQWKQYKTGEQLIIGNRMKRILYDLCTQFEIHYEYTKEGELHFHVVCDTTTTRKDIKIEFQRFFDIHYDAFCKVDDCYDALALDDYLTNKTKKVYQTSKIKPYYSEKKL